jgi:mannose-6-phosphate isomerase
VLFKISNIARDYAWGSKTLIADYFDVAKTGGPMAEIWFGTHFGSPARVVETGEALGAKIGHELSFLLKILAAETPLSIQAHPSTSQAKAGFARENAAGIPVEASNRNYRDDRHKPELIVALTDFQALCGFRSIAEIKALLSDFREIPSLSAGFQSTAADWLSMLDSDSAAGDNQQDGLRRVVADILSRRDAFQGFTAELAGLAEFEAQFELADRLNQLYPGDPGVMIAMLMNQVWLNPGEALFLPAGIIHAYLSGLGVEVMAASDNVLRGGLTTKHVDVSELTDVLQFQGGRVSPAIVSEVSSGLVEFEAPVQDFKLYRARVGGTTGSVSISLPAEAILLCTEGQVSAIAESGEELQLAPAEAAYSDAEKSISISGTGTLFIACGPVGF